MGELQTLAGAAGRSTIYSADAYGLALAFVERLCGQLEQS